SSHVQTGLGIFGFALGFRIAKKDQNGVADKLVESAAMLECDVGHLGKILVEQRGNLFRLQALRGRREILDIGKENRELLALSVNRDVLLSAENALVDLR